MDFTSSFFSMAPPQLQILIGVSGVKLSILKIKNPYSSLKAEEK